MYIQCPACLTTFKVTPAQLAARGGVVRCGICSTIFHAEQRLLQAPPKTGRETATPAREEAASSGTSQRRRSDKNRRATSRRRRDKIKAAPAPFIEETDFPIITELQRPARSRWRAVRWGFADLLLILLLAGQFVYFYRDELAKKPSWRPLLTDFCGYARCQLRPLRDIAAIELLQTTIAPHPQYENALRIRTALVNRADYPQDYPWMEVSLTDNGGRVLTRRTFTPAQYLPTPAAGNMSPNVVATTLLDVTNPDNKAVGYEIRLVTP
ncbi:MAG TPA: DUF3426 domain-containing protein [Candidatus Methylomirabilis sp.]|nr:DUF3426 domain-containing protein [Candidatus Methylomirabilis sp.]